MAVIDKPSDYFNTVLWTGNGNAGTNITGVGFQPNWVWIKRRSAVEFNVWNDSVRGVPKNLYSNSTQVQDSGNLMSAIISDGFTVQTDNSVNANGSTYVAWNWLAGTTSGIATNGATTITPAAYSFNQTSGISIVNYDGNDTAGAKVAHGLGTTPDMMIVKAMNSTAHWAIYHKAMGNTHYMQFDTNAQLDDAGVWNDTSPDSVNFTVGQSDKTNLVTYIAYCFADVPNYSKFGSYVGNGDNSGAFIYTGFKPAFVMIKITAGQTDNWIMQDNKINSFNGASSQRLRPNSSGAEFSSSNEIDLLSNGFKTHGNDGEINGSGFSYIYMAFAENPFVTSTGNGSIPTTAR